jgi:competence protein ComEA
MNEDERISKNILKFMFCGCLVLLVALATIIIFYSPKTISPVFSENSEEPVFENNEFSESDIIEKSEIFPIEINTATYEELQLIPDIGPSTAKLIIDYRNEYGTIVTFTELLSIEGIGNKTVDVLKKYCIIN